MHLRSTVRAGLALAALTAFGPLAFGPAQPAAAAPAKAPARTTRKATAKPKPAAKPAAKAKPAPKVKTAVGSTASKTVENLINAMRNKERDTIASAFNWQRFADEMNKLIPGEKGLDAGTYKTLLVETLSVEKSVSDNLRVGKETKKSANIATVEMRRVFPSGSGGTTQIRPINILTLAKEKDGWRIFRLDSAQPATVTPPVQRSPQGMVPAAGSGSSEKK